MKKFNGIFEVENQGIKSICMYCGKTIVPFGSLTKYVHQDTEKSECITPGGTYAMPTTNKAIINQNIPKTGIEGATAQERKTYPVATGVVDYFPLALVEISHVSYIGNEQHNPGQPLYWDRSKSGDESDALMRHFIHRGTYDTDGIRHTAKIAWRALALLEKELEAERNNVNTNEGNIETTSTCVPAKPYKLCRSPYDLSACNSKHCR